MVRKKREQVQKHKLDKKNSWNITEFLIFRQVTLMMVIIVQPNYFCLIFTFVKMKSNKDA